jgi:hypothetical protein
MIIVVYGYYDHYNLGDELFKEAFLKLFPNNKFTFTNKLHQFYPNADLVIVGGGDLYNEYFLKPLSKTIEQYVVPVIGFGLGFPSYELNKKYLWMFDSVVTRVRDMRVLNLLNYSLFSDSILSMPDIVFSLNKFSKNTPNKKHILLIPSSDRINTYEVNNVINDLNKLYGSSSANIYDLKKDNHLVGKHINTLYKAIVEIDNSSVVVTYKFHGLVISVMRNRLFVCNSNSYKTQELLKQIFPEDLCNKLLFSDITEIDKCIKYAIENKHTIYNYLKKYREYINLIYSKFDGNEYLNKQILKNRRSKISSEKYNNQLANLGVMQSLPLLKIGSNNPYSYGIQANKKLSNMAQIEWLQEDKLKCEKYNRPFNVDTVCQRFSFDIHRHGWNYTINILQSLSSDYGILLDSFLDSSYRSLPYLKPWYGIIHHPKHIPLEYSDANLDRLMNSEFFKLSMPFCKGLITLSKYMKEQVKSYNNKIPLFSLLHPMHLSNKVWDYSKWNLNRKVYSIGTWLRNVFSIYRLNYGSKYVVEHPHLIPPKTIYVYSLKDVPNVIIKSSEFTLGSGSSTCKNVWLYFANQYFNNLGYQLTEEYHDKPRLFIMELVVQQLIKSVTIIKKMSPEDYDVMLTNSILLLDLFEVSASNALVECIMSCTPVYVKKHPAIVEYIGNEYPLFFENVDEIDVKDKDLINAHKYLLKLDKYKFTSDAFRDEMLKIANK